MSAYGLTGAQRAGDRVEIDIELQLRGLAVKKLIAEAERLHREPAVLLADLIDAILADDIVDAILDEER